VINEQVGAGHNLSLSVNAAAYHMKVLSFVEECAVACRGERSDGNSRASATTKLEAG
jgi:hypothetical protein